MIDPFLLAHQVAPLSFEIGGILSPVSIRDQMLRGRWIIDRILEAGLVAPGEKLLIIGAGAAGVTAAIEGAARGIYITLVDTAPAPFLRQAGCSSRWVDPTQYDWPLDHWPHSRFPWRPPAMPLPWTAGRANILAIAWTWALNRAIASYGPLLDIRFGARLSGFPALDPSRRDLVVNFNPPGTAANPESFKVAVSTVGFGTEKTSFDDFSSYRFWDTDPLERSDYGLPGVRPRILISGGGDGALQDFIRVATTAHSARQIYDALPLAIKTMVEPAIQSAEDQAQRAYLWGTPGSAVLKARDHKIHERLHQAFMSQIDLLENHRSLWPLIVTALCNIVRPAGLAEITLVHPCGHLDRGYALNRFLVLLLDRFYQRVRGVVILHPNVKVTGVSGRGHTCANDPAWCYGQMHTVSFSAFACQGFSWPGAPAMPANADYEIVLLRHGIQPLPSVYGGVAGPIQFPRQMLPYYSPW